MKRAMRTAVMVLAMAAGAALGAGPGKPDIVIFLADDLGFADVGFNGCKDIATPAIDRLAAGGAVLGSFYVQNLCTPTRAALLTGRYPIRYGLQEGVIRPGEEYGLPLGERTLASALREAGYTTAICGKWHLGEYNPAFLPTKRGFDIQYGHYFGMIDYTTHVRMDRVDWHRNDQPCDDQGYSTHLIAREACRVVREQPKDKPLFLYVPFNAVHAPYHTAPGRESDFAALSKARREYATMLDEMDKAIARVLAALDEAGRRKNALILFSSDNGGIGPADNGPLRGTKATPYEGGHRAAACVAWEGRIKAGSRIDEPFHMVDWYPTLLRIAGAPLEQPRPPDGRDLLPLLTGGAKTPHDTILLHCQPGIGALRMGDWKLVIHESAAGARKKAAARAQVELFNLAADLGEKNNLADREPAKLAELRAKLDAFAKEACPPRGDPTGRVGTP